MQVLEAIRTRRSIGKVTPERPSREEIETILDAATWAPNHFVTNPWRFVVVAGADRIELGRVMARSKIERMRVEGRDTTGEEETLVAKALRAPVIVAVGVEPGDGPKVVAIEEIEAGAAAVQNMLLAAHAIGLAAMWRTGDPAYDPHVRAHLGMSDAAALLGFVYVGYPAVSKVRENHVPFEQLTEWRGWVE